MDLQTLNPDNGNSPIPENFFSGHLGLADLQAFGGVATFDSLFGTTLDPRTVITNVGIYVKKALVGAGLTVAAINIGAQQGGSNLYVAGASDISNNTVTDDSYVGGVSVQQILAGTKYAVPSSPAGSTFSKVTIVTGGVNGIPDAITGNAAIAGTDILSVSGITSDMTPQSYEFKAQTNARDLVATLTLTGINFAALTAGEIYIYVWTKQIPSYVAG